MFSPVILGIVSLIITRVFALFNERMKFKNEQKKLKIKSMRVEAKANLDSREAAREFGKKDKGVKITRRFIAISLVFATILFPKIFFALSVWNGVDVNVFYGYLTEKSQGWFFFSHLVDHIEWITLDGLPVHPVEWELLGMVTGFYFGDKVKK